MYSKASELFKDTWKDKRILFCITEDDIQVAAERRLKRKLTDNEIEGLGKQIEELFSEGMMTKIETALALNVGA